MSRSIRLIAVLCMALPGAGVAGEAVTVALTDQVAGGTVKYLGGYLVNRTLLNPEAKKHLAASEINCTKVWLPIARGGREEHWKKLSGRPGKFYGDDYKEYAVRQFTQSPETIDWMAEVGCDPKKMSKRETEFKMYKDNDIEPVLNIDKRLYGDEKMRRAYWRYTFLLNCYLNKVRDYKFTLWEFGCEDSEGGPEQLEVGSDAVREAVKITGLTVVVAGCGDDAKFEPNFTTVLSGNYADRVDALTYHSFQFIDTFPALGRPGWQADSPTLHLPLKAALQRFDDLQKKLRPGAQPLPYWDTGWSWKKFGGTEKDFPACSDPQTAMAYVGRIIQECESRATMNLYCRLFDDGENKDESYSGAMEVTGGKLAVYPLFFAMRMMARANAGEKERLRIGEKPDDAVMQALATRSASHVFVTCLSRREDAVLKVTIKGLDPYRGKKYVIRRLDGKELKDDVAGEGVLDGDLAVELPPLTAFQVAIERKRSGAGL